MNSVSLPSAFLLVISLLFFAGCATYRSGRQSDDGPPESGAGFALGVVEFDDQGKVWNRDDADRILEVARREAEKGGATIVVFIHGWHHSARAGDANLVDFRKALLKLKTEMDAPIYRSARGRLVGHEDATLIGVYIGWRGRSLPGFLDYLTFWDRKPAAERVGRGDVVELLSTLDRIWIDSNQRDLYTGLITIGHSFGA
ncbi:MAG: hypothetical protein ABI837_14890, partial [Acidobacteriota bacterium]